MEQRSVDFQVVANQIGLNEVARGLDEPAEIIDHAAEAIFDSQQMVLANIMVVSALLLGFIVTGTLLSVELTGSENFGITELMPFFNWSALAAMFAFLSLTTSFLTSVWGSNFMTTAGPKEAAIALTSGSVLRHIAAEGSLYMSLFFFLVSLNQYIKMVYSGPDICPTYRGRASFCAQQAEDLYWAAKEQCAGKCTPGDLGRAHECPSDSSPMECLCAEFCAHAWEREKDWTKTEVDRPAGVNVSYYHFFGYSTPSHISKPSMAKVVSASAALSCQQPVLRGRSDRCFRDGSPDCGDIFIAWRKSEECQESAIQGAMRCHKVCAWRNNYPPRESLNQATHWAFIPLGIMLLMLTLTRSIVIAVRACRAVYKQHHVMRQHISSLSPKSREESDG